MIRHFVITLEDMIGKQGVQHRDIDIVTEPEKPVVDSFIRASYIAADIARNEHMFMLGIKYSHTSYNSFNEMLRQMTSALPDDV